jgi:hypothetical protein
MTQHASGISSKSIPLLTPGAFHTHSYDHAHRPRLYGYLNCALVVGHRGKRGTVLQKIKINGALMLIRSALAS